VLLAIEATGCHRREKPLLFLCNCRTGTGTVTSTTAIWRRLRALAHHRRAQLALSLRVTISAVATLALAQVLQVPLPLWAVLTAVVVTQMSVGRSLKATFDYLVGTFGGAIYGGAIGVLFPHGSEILLLVALALAVAPLAFIATINPRFSAAPITAIIVLLVPMLTHATAITSALDRIIEVALGGVTGLVVSFLLLPSNAHRLVVAAAARTLDQMAWALGQLLGGVAQGLDADSQRRIHDRIGEALVQLNAFATEAEQERSARLAQAPDTGPLLRTLLRLRHDLVMIGRAAVYPLPEAVKIRLSSPLQEVGATLVDHLRASGAALRAGGQPPSLAAIETALAAYAAEVAAIRRDGLTRSLSGEAAESFFALGFALEQMRSNLKDLERCVAEWAASSENAGRKKPHA
jgi:uncharacterized membrane protein YccC